MNSPRSSLTRRLAVVAAAGLCLAVAACSSKPAPPAGGATGSKPDKARKEAEALAVNGVTGGASAQAQAMPELAVKRDWSMFGGRVTVDGDWHLHAGAPKPVLPKGGAPKPPAPPEPVKVVKGPPAPKAPPRPGGGPLAVRERVVSTVPYATEAEAEDDACALARELVEKKLAELDPPVRRKLSVNEVKTEFLRKDSRTVRLPDAEEQETFAQYGVSGKLVYVEYDIEITADQVRELRAQERVAGGMRVLGMLVAVALAGFLFLRADEWTRGYLTSWLAIGAVALAGGAAAALIFV